MQNSTSGQLSFPAIAGFTVRADFDGGALSTDFGALLLAGVERQTGLIARLADVIRDHRHPSYIDYSVGALLQQRIYRDLYCARGQDENYIKAVKNDLASDRTSDHAFLAYHLRLFYACAAYVLIHSVLENTLCHTELAQPQPMSIILKLFKLAVRVVQYKDRIKLPCPMPVR